MSSNRQRSEGRSKLAHVVASAAIVGVLLFLLLIALAPDSVAYSPNNYGWNGIHEVYSQYSMRPISSLSQAVFQGNKSVLLLLAPVESFSPSDAATASLFVRQGGILIVADSSGSANSLLDHLGVKISIESNYSVSDPLYNWKTPALPIAVVKSTYTLSSILRGVQDIALDEPSPLLISPNSSAAAFATTSSLSSAGLRGHSGQSISGPFAVAAGQSLGRGMVLVIGGGESFMNSLDNVGGNPVLFSNVFSGGTVYLDASHWPLDTSAYLKATVSTAYYLLFAVPYRYIAALAIIGITVAIWPISATIKTADMRTSYYGKPEQSDYDPRIVEKIRKDKERWGIMEL